MTYTCKFDCGAETETLNELKWHYQSNHADEYNFWTDIQPIVDQMMLESGPVEPGDTIYPDGSSKPYNPLAALFWFAVVALLPSVALGCLTTYFIYK